MDGGPLDKIIVLTYFTNFNKSYAYSRDMEKVIFSFLNIVKIATFPLQHFIIFSQPTFYDSRYFFRNENKEWPYNENMKHSVT